LNDILAVSPSTFLDMLAAAGFSESALDDLTRGLGFDARSVK
jgi:hypothetical protein